MKTNPPQNREAGRIRNNLYILHIVQHPRRLLQEWKDNNPSEGWWVVGRHIGLESRAIWIVEN